MARIAPSSWFQTFAVLALSLGFALLAGCQSPSGFTVEPAYQPAGVPSVGQGEAIAVRVTDKRMQAPAGGGKVVLARGDKGSIYMARPFDQALQDALAKGFTAAGFRVDPSADVVVDVSLQTFDVKANEFTSWGLSNETGTPLDIRRAVLPGPERTTEMRSVVSFVIRKHNQRLGYAGDAKDHIVNKSREMVIVEQTLNQLIASIVNQTVSRAAPDVDKAKMIPVSDAELKAAWNKVQEQQRSLENLRASVNAEQEKLRADRAKFTEIQQNAMSEVAAERDRLAAAREQAQAQKKQYEDKLAELQSTQKQLADNGELTQQKKDELAAERQQIEADRAKLATQLDQLARQQEQLARREQNLAEHEQELAARAREQSELKDKLATEDLRLTQWRESLQQWEEKLKQAAAQPSSATATASAAPTPPADLTRRVAPRVHIVEPVASRSTTTLPTVEVKGVVVHTRPIAEVRYAVTATEPPVEQFADAAEPGTTYKGIRPERWKRVPLKVERVSPDGEQEVSQTFSFNVPLTQGFNRIIITAIDADGEEGAAERIVERRSDEGQVHIIAIGINSYENKDQVPQLKYAVADAQAVAGALQAGLDVPQENVKLLLDQEATKQNIENWLGDQLPGRVGKGDTVVIFFSGHGAPEATPGVGGVEKYLLPVNADPSRCFSTGIAMKRIAEIFRRLPAERVLFVIDSCFSGAATGGGRGLESNLKGIRVTRVDRSLEATKRIVLTGSQGNQPSQEKDELKHGVFSYYLVKALQGAADRDADKQITLDEVFRYVSANVTSATDNRQTPVVSPELSAEPAAANVVMSHVK